MWSRQEEDRFEALRLEIAAGTISGSRYCVGREQKKTLRFRRGERATRWRDGGMEGSDFNGQNPVEP